MSTPARRLARHGATNIVNGAITHLSVAVAAAVLFRRIGPEFGVFALVTSGALSLNLLEDSVGLSVIRKVANARRDDGVARIRTERNLAGLAGVTFVFLFGLGLLALYHQRSDRWEIALLGAALIGSFAWASFESKILEGREEYPWLRRIQSGVAVSRTTLVVGLVLGGIEDVRVLIACHGLATLIQGGLCRWRRTRTEAIGRVDTRQPGESVREVFGFVRPFAIAKVSNVFSYRLDQWLVELAWGTSAVAAVALAETLARVAQQSLEVIKGALVPVSITHWREGDAAWIRQFVLGVSKAAFWLSAGTCVAAYAALDPLLSLWFGAVGADTTITAELLLAFTVTLSFHTAVQGVLTGQGLFGRLERPIIIAAVVNVVVSVPAIFYGGAWGGALGTAIAGGVLLIASVTRSEQLLGLPRAVLWIELVLPGTALVAVSAAAGRLCPLPADSTRIVELLVRAGVAGTILTAGTWGLILRADERRALGALRRSRAG